MSTFWSCIIMLAAVVMDIWFIANAGRYFSEKKWGWFGINTYLAIYWTVWIIHHAFG